MWQLFQIPKWEILDIWQLFEEPIVRFYISRNSQLGYFRYLATLLKNPIGDFRYLATVCKTQLGDFTCLATL
jgi:hypothetical protein